MRRIYTPSLGSFMFPPEPTISGKKILVVFGATGNQGGSVIRSILSDPETAAEYKIHAITRRTTKAAAKSLAEKGVTVIQADLDDKSSLRTALKDAHTVFGVTNFNELMSKEREIQQGKNIADICKELNVQHLIWSSLPNVSKLSNNALTKVAHFDSKATVEEHIRALAIPATFLHLSVFMILIPSWLTRTSAPHKPAAYTISLPIALTTRIPLISAASSTGVYVKSLLTHREKVLGRQISAAQEWYLLEEIVEIVREEAGLDVVFRRCSGEEYVAGLAVGGMPKFFQGAILENMRWGEEWGFFAEKIRDVYTGHELLGEPLETFRVWVRAGGMDHLKEQEGDAKNS